MKLIKAESGSSGRLLSYYLILSCDFSVFDWVGIKQQSYFNCCRLILTEAEYLENYITASGINGGYEAVQVEESSVRILAWDRTLTAL